MSNVLGIMLGIGILLVAVAGAALYIAVIEPIQKGVNDATGPAVGKSSFYETSDPGFAILFGAPLLILVVGVFGLWKASQT